MGICMEVLGLLKQTTVEPVIFLYMMAAFVQFPSLQDLIYTRVCSLHYNKSTVCEHLHESNFTTENDFVQEETSKWLMRTNVASTLSSVLTVSFVIGPLGDKVGRKPPIILPIIGTILYNICNLVISLYKEAPLSYLLIGCFIDGIFGGFIAVLMSVFSFIGHVSTSKNKTNRVGVNVGMIYVAGTLGYLVSGFIIDKTNFVVVFAFVVSMLIIALLYTIFLIDNVKSPDPDGSELDMREKSKSCLVDNMWMSWACITRKRRDRATLFIALLISVIALVMICTTGQNDILLLYTKLPKFHWSQTTYGIYRAGESLFQGVALLVLLPVLRNYYHVTDTSIIIAGLVSRIVSAGILAVAKESWHLYISAFAGGLHAFPSTGLRSCMSSLVGQNEQGKLFGFVASTESLSALFATLIFNKLYPATLSLYDGTSFLVSAGIQVIAFFISIWIHVKRGDHGKNYQYSSFTEEECNDDVREDSVDDVGDLGDIQQYTPEQHVPIVSVDNHEPIT